MIQEDTIVTNTVSFGNVPPTQADYMSGALFVSGAKLWFSPDGTAAEIITSTA